MGNSNKSKEKCQTKFTGQGKIECKTVQQMYEEIDKKVLKPFQNQGCQYTQLYIKADVEDFTHPLKLNEEQQSKLAEMLNIQFLLANAESFTLENITLEICIENICRNLRHSAPNLKKVGFISCNLNNQLCCRIAEIFKDKPEFQEINIGSNNISVEVIDKIKEMFQENENFVLFAL